MSSFPNRLFQTHVLLLSMRVTHVKNRIVGRITQAVLSLKALDPGSGRKIPAT